MRQEAIDADADNDNEADADADAVAFAAGSHFQVQSGENCKLKSLKSGSCRLHLFELWYACVLGHWKLPQALSSISYLRSPKSLFCNVARRRSAEGDNGCGLKYG